MSIQLSSESAQPSHEAPLGNDKPGDRPVEIRPVWSCNEWDPLEEVIVGRPENARYPDQDVSSRSAEFPDCDLEAMPSGPFSAEVLEETSEDLDAFVHVLEQAGAKVRRPLAWPHDKQISTVSWSTKGYYNYCPRDILLVVADQLIETPSVIRGRSQEVFSYRDLLNEYYAAGSNWFSAPTPMLNDDLFQSDSGVPAELEPAFDAANVLRLGEDLLYLVSATGNRMGGEWLQRVLPKPFRVHFLEGVYEGSHIDSTFAALRPGLVLCNPGRVDSETIPGVFDNWTTIFCPPIEGEPPLDAGACIGSSWIDMNLFSISPDTVIVDRDQIQLMRLLESHGLNVVPHKLRHSRRLGGGYHCVTLDVRRSGQLESYLG